MKLPDVFDALENIDREDIEARIAQLDVEIAALRVERSKVWGVLDMQEWFPQAASQEQGGEDG